MNPEIKTRWVAALRSGEYAQTKQALRDENGFCCLGVLCDVVKDDLGIEWTDTINKNDSCMLFDDAGGFLPSSVMRYADLPDCNPTVESYGDNLSRLNDFGYTFEEIANAIEVDL